MEIRSNAVKPVGTIEEGWNLIKDDYWTFFGMTTLFVVMMIAVLMVIGFVNNIITMAVTAAFAAVSKNSGAAAVVPQIVALTISIFTNVIFTTFTGVLMCGLMNALARKVRTGLFEFGDLFSGFSKLMPCLIASLVLSLIQYVIAIGAVLIGVIFGVTLNAQAIFRDGKPDPAMLTGILGILAVVGIIWIIISLVISVCTAFIYPLIAERGLSGIEAIMTSVRGGFSNFLPLIGFFILQFLMAFAGALLCLVGILFVIPISYAAMFAAYRNVFGGIQGNSSNSQPPPPPIFNNQPGY